MKKTRLVSFAAIYCAFTIAGVEISAQISTNNVAMKAGGWEFQPKRINFLMGQRADTVRLLFDQAHGEQAPPGQMDAIAKKLGLEIQTSAQPISAESLKGVRI